MNTMHDKVSTNAYSTDWRGRVSKSFAVYLYLLQTPLYVKFSLVNFLHFLFDLHTTLPSVRLCVCVCVGVDGCGCVFVDEMKEIHLYLPRRIGITGSIISYILGVG